MISDLRALGMKQALQSYHPQARMLLSQPLNTVICQFGTLLTDVSCRVRYFTNVIDLLCELRKPMIEPAHANIHHAWMILNWCTKGLHYSNLFLFLDTCPHPLG